MKTYNRKLPFNWSNNNIYEYIDDRIKSNDGIMKIMFDVSERLPYINIQETLDKTINLLCENNLMYSDNIKIIEFKKKLNRLGYKNYIKTKIEAEFYGLFIFYLYQNEYSKFRINNELIDMEYKISDGQLFHNKERLNDEVIKIENNERINEIEKLSLLEQIKAYLDLIKEFEKHQFLNKTNNYTSHIKYFKKCIKRLEKEIIIENNLSNNTISKIEKKNILNEIWLAEAKLSIEDFLEKGVSNGIWNKNYYIITKKGSLYGTGKSLLASLSIALIGYSISKNTDYKKIGELFCKTFNIEISVNTKEPYKSFQSGNQKKINEFKRAFKIS